MARNVINAVSLTGGGVKKPKAPQAEHLKFTFGSFRTNSILIENEFNNHYKNQDEFVRKMNILFGKALPQLSNEDSGLFSDIAKLESLHMHRVRNKEEMLIKVFKAYGYPEEAINNILEGEEVYQFEVPYENGSSRVFFERINGNVISLLFLDPNHHIYMDKDKVDKARSLFYEYCPVYEVEQCKRMDYFKTCFAFEFLDEQKFAETYTYSYPEKVIE